MVRALITIRCSSSGIECDSLAQARRHGAAIVPTGARAPAEHRPPSPQQPDARRGVRVQVAVGAAQRSERSGEPGCGRAPRHTDVTTADAERVSARQAGCDQRAHAGGSGMFALARANEVLSQEVMQPTCPPGAWNDGGHFWRADPGQFSRAPKPISHPERSRGGSRREGAREPRGGRVSRSALWRSRRGPRRERACVSLGVVASLVLHSGDHAVVRAATACA